MYYRELTNHNNMTPIITTLSFCSGAKIDNLLRQRVGLYSSVAWRHRL